jgi:molybdate transport system permease protein
MTAIGGRAAAVRGPAPDRVSGQRSWGNRVLIAVAGLFALFLALPVATLVARSVLDGSLLDAINTPAVLTALGLSLATTAVSLMLTVVLGLPLAFVLARRTFRLKWLVEGIVDLPIVLPPSVAGLALLLVFGRRGVLSGPLGLTGMDIAFTTAAVILAQTFVSAPFFVRSARTGIAAIERELEDAARVDGASEWRLFRSITAPLAAAALAAGLVMSWARALGEFGATIVFAGSLRGVTQTLPLAIYAEFATNFDVALALGALLVLVSGAILLLAKLAFAWKRSTSTSLSPFARFGSS